MTSSFELMSLMIARDFSNCLWYIVGIGVSHPKLCAPRESSSFLGNKSLIKSLHVNIAGLAIPNGSYTDPMCPATPLLVLGRSLCSILTLNVPWAMCH